MGDTDATRRSTLFLHRLLVLLLPPLLAPGLQPAEAGDCRDETPLPADARLIAPGPDIAPEAARFAGAWSGPWKDGAADIICATLVVEEILPARPSGRSARHPPRRRRPRDRR